MRFPCIPATALPNSLWFPAGFLLRLWFFAAFLLLSCRFHAVSSHHVSAPIRICRVPATDLLNSCCIPNYCGFLRFCCDAPALLLVPSSFLIGFFFAFLLPPSSCYVFALILRSCLFLLHPCCVTAVVPLCYCSFPLHPCFCSCCDAMPNQNL